VWGSDDEDIDEVFSDHQDSDATGDHSDGSSVIDLSEHYD
jgi:hypothetical protein